MDLLNVGYMATSQSGTNPEQGASASGSSTSTDDDHRDNKAFECNICLDTARDAVISMCGHLFW